MRGVVRLDMINTYIILDIIANVDYRYVIVCLSKCV